MPTTPLSSLAGKSIALEPQLPRDRREGLEPILRALGGHVVSSGEVVAIRVVPAGAFGQLARRDTSETLVTLEELEPLLVPRPEAILALLREGWPGLRSLEAAGVTLDLTGLDLSGLDLSGFYLTRTPLEGCSLNGCNLSNAYLYHPKVIDFSGVRSIQGATIVAAEWCEFVGLDLSSVDLQGRFERCDFRRAFVNSATLRGCSPVACCFSGVDLRGFDLNHWQTARLVAEGADFSGADLSRADLRGANLRGASFTRANLTGTRLEGANLDGVDLSVAHGLPDRPTPPAIYTPPASLAELSKTLGDGATWCIRLRIERPDGDHFRITLGQQDGRCQVRLGETTTSEDMPNLVAACRWLGQYRPARPVMDSVELLPLRIGRRIEFIALAVIFEALGLPAPSEHELEHARRRRMTLRLRDRDDALAQLRQGAKHVEAWNLAYAVQPHLHSLRGVDLAGCALARIDLSLARAAGANFARANLRQATMPGVNLVRANLAGANLREADLSGGQLECANLAGAKLAFADLSRANLTMANLAGADLTGARLVRTKLAGVDLRDVRLDFADLTSVPEAIRHLPPVRQPTTPAQMHRELIRRGVPANRLLVATRELLDGRRPRHMDCDGQNLTAILPDRDGPGVQACRLTWQGHHECANHEFQKCPEANQDLCWHLLLLLLAAPEMLTHNTSEILAWVARALRQRPRSNDDEIATILLREQSPQECDFRPNEMLPEDYYTP